MQRLLALISAFSLAAAAHASRIVVCDDVKDPPTLDPFIEFSEKNHTILQQMLEGLVRFDPDGNIEPALAESWTQRDPLHLRFHLRKGVRFHDGEPFQANDVRFSIEHYIDPSAGFPGRSFFGSIDHVDVVDPYTVDLVTRYPDGVLIRRLAGLITIVPAAYYNKVGSAGFSNHPVGTGPFEFDRWLKGREIILKAAHRYWKPSQPKVDELVFRFLSPQDQVKALLSGDADIVMEMPGTFTLQVMQNPMTTVLKKESFYTVGATINVSHWPLSDVRFRKALNYAIDRAELIRYDLLGNGQPLATLSMPGEVGNDPSLKPYPYDPNKAKQLIRAMGVKTPCHLKTLLRLQGERTAHILAKQFESIGVILDTEIGTESDLIQKFKAKDWDIGIAGVPDPTAHSSFIQSILLYSHSPYSIQKSTDFDHRLEDAIATLDPAAHEAKNRALDRYIYENALSLFTYQRIKTYGVNRKVRFVPYITGMPYFYETEVGPEEKNP